MKEIKNEIEEPIIKESKNEITWVDAYIDEKYELSIDLIDKKLRSEIDEKEKVLLNIWKGNALLKKDYIAGINHLSKIIEEYPNEELAYSHLANEFLTSGDYSKCIELTDQGIKVISNPSSLIGIKIRCLKETGQNDAIPQLLDSYMQIFPNDTNLIEIISDFYRDEKKYDISRIMLENTLKKFPSNKSLLIKYGYLLYTYYSKEEALIIYNRIIELDKGHVASYVFRGNIYVHLELNGLAMNEYKIAESLSKTKRTWIISNIGNLYKNVGLYFDAIKYLKQATEIEPDDGFSHDRLSFALKGKEEEENKLKEIIKEAKVLISQFKVEEKKQV